MIVVLFVPVAFGFPAMISAIPPTVILIPTTLAFGVQIAASFLGLVAVLTPLMDRFVQSCLSSFDGMLAL